MATAAFFDTTGGSSSSSASSMLESVELRSRNSKNHATATDPWRHESPNGGSGNGRVQLMEHKVKNGETIMQIALLYSIPVSEIKRVNNIVSDQEIHALPIVKVPISRQFLLRRQLMESNGSGGEGQIISLDNDEPQQLQQSTSSSITNGTIHHSTMAGIIGSPQQGKNSDKLPLLDYQDQNLHGSAESLLSDNGTGGTRTRLAIEGILDEADRTVAAVRQNLPSSPGLEGGAFHFVDAGAPDHSSNIWLIVIVVVIMFVLIPLGLTFLEETNEEEHHQQTPHHNGLMEKHDG